MKHHHSQLALDFDAPIPAPPSQSSPALAPTSRPGASAVRLTTRLHAEEDPIDPTDPFAAEYADMRRYRRTWTSSHSRARRIRVVHDHYYPIRNCLRCLNTRLVNGLPCPACVLETWARP